MARRVLTPRGSFPLRAMRRPSICSVSRCRGGFVGRPPPLPLQRQIGPTRVFNVGSVGFPFDGDLRAAYGILNWSEGKWSTELRRVPYPVETVLESLASPEFHEG